MNIPMIELFLINGDSYILADEIFADQVYSAVYERKRFKQLRDFLMKADRINDNDFADMLSTRYFISADHINDARLAAAAIFFKLREKGIDRGNRIKVESTNPFVFFEGSPKAVLAKPDADIIDPFGAINNGYSIMTIIDGSTFDPDIESEDMYDDKLRFFVYCGQNDPNSDDTRIRNSLSESCISISIGSDSPADLREAMESFFYQKDYDISLVEDEIRKVSFYIPQSNEYSAVQICRKIISNHLLDDPESRKLAPKDAANIFMSLKNGKKAKAPEKKIRSDHRLIGLEAEMKKVQGVIDLLELERSRKEMGIETDFDGCNMLFAGPPGTAKTSLARFFANRLEQFGLISSADNFKECTKSDIVGKYVGHTAANVDEMFREMDEKGGGVIFFDEIYTLAEEDSTAYDREAVTCITQNMENYRKTVFCIFAGYENKMKEFLSSNPGLRSRIQFTVKFREYSCELLCEIFKTIAAHGSCNVPKDCDDILQSYFTRLKKLRGEQFGNGREARNLYSNALRKLAERVSGKRISRKSLTTFTREDISAAAEEIISSELGTNSPTARPIGF